MNTVVSIRVTYYKIELIPASPVSYIACPLPTCNWVNLLAAAQKVSGYSTHQLVRSRAIACP